mmetsp:Transcript_27834/g.67395  ORF Transcript_27834/g.67395 Transcript_27834/m.67395 type:complete len:83 (+) Transcript_27834:3094-3342(+)
MSWMHDRKETNDKINNQVTKGKTRRVSIRDKFLHGISHQSKGKHFKKRSQTPVDGQHLRLLLQIFSETYALSDRIATRWTLV